MKRNLTYKEMKRAELYERQQKQIGIYALLLLLFSFTILPILLGGGM